jgi:hypothetical protein
MVRRMDANRFQRRRAVLAGRKRTPVDPCSAYLEAARRARAARRVRVLARRQLPVLLVHSRWSALGDFLADLKVDLSLDRTPTRCVQVDLAPLASRSMVECWEGIMRQLVEGLDLPTPVRATAPVDERGFIHELRELVDGTSGRACVCFTRAADVPVKILQELLDALSGRIGVVMATRVVPAVAVFDLRVVELPDYEPKEAVGRLVEHLGAQSIDDLTLAVELLGGVPALLDVVTTRQRLMSVCENQTEVWRVVGSIADEFRQVVDIAAADDALSERLEQISSFGPLDEGPRDVRLIQAGLVLRRPGGKVCIRTPIFGELAINA